LNFDLIYKILFGKEMIYIKRGLYAIKSRHRAIPSLGKGEEGISSLDNSVARINPSLHLRSSPPHPSRGQGMEEIISNNES